MAGSGVVYIISLAKLLSEPWRSSAGPTSVRLNMQHRHALEAPMHGSRVAEGRAAPQVAFIIGQLKAHADAVKLLGELQAVLDEEAPGFVLKLFRSVIFDTEKQALGLLEA